MSEVERGATRDEWFHFDFVLGLGENLLPCVPASPDVKVLKGSALDGKVGKIPSQFNRAGEAHGLLDWQKRPILSNEVQLWSADRRLNLCVRTGSVSGVYAIDVDVEDGDTSRAIRQLLDFDRLGIARRCRVNSGKFLIPFRMEGVKCPKRRIKLDSKASGPAIELLADGQQFVACGSHSSGARYQWQPGLPWTLPTLTLDQLNQIWTQLTSAFAHEKPSAGAQSVSPNTPTASAKDTTAESATHPTSDTTPFTQLSEITDGDWEELRSALRSLIPHAGSNDTWSEIGYSLLSLTNKPARQLWIDFSKKAPGYVEGAPEQWWDAHARSESRTDYRHIFTLARRNGWNKTSPVELFPVVAAAVTEDGNEVVDVPPPPLPEKPIIRVVEGQHSEILDQIEAVMKPEVYTQGPYLTRIADGHEEAEIERTTDAKMLVRVTPAWARKRMGEVATFQRYAAAKAIWYTVDPTGEHANALCGLGSWKKLRPLDAIARAPFIRPDGSICEQPGYDCASRTLLVPSLQFPPIPANPSRADAMAALERVRGVFDQFPWKEPASESAFLAHVLSEAARIAINRCPMFWYSAPDAGTGKGYLQAMAARIVHGNVPSLRPWVADADEIRKTLYASLLAGDRSLLFDNVPDGSKIRTPELCAFITAPNWEDRKLGASEVVGIANKAVLSASGNNVTPVSDLARRSLVIRMITNMSREEMKKRVFKIPDIEDYALRNRDWLLVDVLTIIRAYQQLSPKPVMPVVLQTFEQWDALVRQPLLWLGMADPVITQNETDDETESMHVAFAKLLEHFQEREFTAVEVAKLSGGLSDPNGDLTQIMNTAGCSEPNSPTKIGYWLRGVRDRVAGGFKLVNLGHGMRGAKWKFHKLEVK